MPTSLDVLDVLPTEMRDLLQKRFKAVDAMDLDAFVALHSGNHRFVFGYRPVVIGRDDMAEQVAGFWASIHGLTHNLRHVAVTDERVYVESVVDYERLDRRQVQVPCCDVFAIRNGRIEQTWAYIDQTPVWEP